MKRTSVTTPAIAFLFALLCLLFAGPVAGDIKIGEPAPDYLGKTRENEKVYISDHAGKVVVVNFWATWCKPCHKELPVLSIIQQKAGHDRLEVFSVNFQEGGRTFRKAAEALSDLDVTFLRDTGSISRSYDVEALPFLVIVGKNGLVKHMQTGYAESEIPSMVARINEALVEEYTSSEEQVEAQ